MSIIYWDFDGTLVKSNHLWSSSVFKALNETVSCNETVFNQIRQYMKKGFTWNSPFEDYSQLTGEKWWDFMNDYFLKSYMSMGYDRNTALLATEKIRGIITNPENYELYNDAVITLDKLKNSGHKNIILSNNYPELYETIKKLGIDKYFDGFVVSALEGYDKPRQELFEIAKAYNNHNEKMFMVGDNEVADIKGGKKAGMTTVLVHSGFCTDANYCADELAEIIDIVKND